MRNLHRGSALYGRVLVDGEVGIQIYSSLSLSLLLDNLSSFEAPITSKRIQSTY